MLKEFMSRVFYSFYYLRWKAVGWKPHLLVIFNVFIGFAVLQAFALLQMASLISFLAFGRSIPLWLPGYLLLTVALHAGLWRWLGGRQGLLGIIRTYGRQRKIAFKVSAERYVFIFWILSMLVLGAGCACLYIESELARDGTRHFAGSGP